jgi:hypothetical protein
VSIFVYPSHKSGQKALTPIHLISFEFQNIDNDQGSPPKNFFFPFNCYDLAIREVTLAE